MTTYERAVVTFSDGYAIEFPLGTGPMGERTWLLLCKSACYHAEMNTGKCYRPTQVTSVRIQEGPGRGAH